MAPSPGLHQLLSLWARKGHLSRRQEFDLRASLRKNYPLCSKRAPKTRKGQCQREAENLRAKESQVKRLLESRRERERERSFRDLKQTRVKPRRGGLRRCERGRRAPKLRRSCVVRLAGVQEEEKRRGHTHARGKGSER